MEPYKLWHLLPEPVQAVVRESALFDYLHWLNERLWASDAYVRWRYDFEPIEIQCGDFSTELWGPSQLAPWWLEYEEHGCHEPLTTRTLVDHAERGDIVWDMGSRLGYFSGVASAVTGAPENVHTFEAALRSIRFIDEMNRVCFDGELHVNHCRIGGDSAESIDLVTYAETHGYPDLIKMDIEGSEVDAISELMPLYRECSPALIVEVHPAFIEQQGSTDAELRSTVEDLYDDIRVSFDFRSPAGSWKPLDNRWNERFDTAGGDDESQDLYQLFCTNP